MKNIVSYGGGTQSTAMILMALEGEFNLPRPDFGVYADTGGEPEFINEYVKYFIKLVKDTYDFDIFTVQYKNGLLRQLIDDPIKISKSGKKYISSNPPYFTLAKDGTRGMMQRQCSVDYKIKPIQRFIKSKIGNEPYNIWIGISFDERSRMKISTVKNRTNKYPLVDNFISRMNSITFCRNVGVKKPQRSSCYFCPFHSNRYWEWLQEYHHTEFNKACGFEAAMQSRTTDYQETKLFLHRSCKPLNEVQFSDPDQLNMFPELIDECGGECGI